MHPDERDRDSTSDASKLPANEPRPGTAAQSREEEAHDTRAGRPMPEEDSADRAAHHKSGYGGEHGQPRKRADQQETGGDEVK